MENSLVEEYLNREGYITLNREEAKVLWINLKNNWLDRSSDYKLAKRLMDRLYRHAEGMDQRKEEDQRYKC